MQRHVIANLAESGRRIAGITTQEWIWKILASSLSFSFCRATVIAKDLVMRCARKFITRNPRTIACTAIYLSGFFSQKDFDKITSQPAIRNTIHALFHVEKLQEKKIANEFRIKYWTVLGLPVLQHAPPAKVKTPAAIILHFLLHKTVHYLWTLPQIAKEVGRDVLEVEMLVKELLVAGQVTATACFGKVWYAARRV